MKLVDEFRDARKAEVLAARIRRLAPELARARGRTLQVMEVCGGHTHAIFRHGIAQLLPPELEFVHGPGCPVCVMPMGRIDDAVSIALQPRVVFATFGDAMRVPGSRMSLLQAKAAGADVRTVYSPLDALRIARAHPGLEVVFFALGFETTMPATALTVLQAREDGIANFSVFCNHITIVPTLKAVLDSPGLTLDGFLGPGHVAMVTGAGPFDFVASRYRRPLVIAGFEPLDVLQALWMVLRQLAEGRCAVENQYARVVRPEGNAAALRAIGEVFELREYFEWRGLGSIDHSGVRLRSAFAAFDAEQRFALPGLAIADPTACQCGEVLKGSIRPHQCKVFGKSCTPETPIGSLMVSSEGACAAYYRYARIPAAEATR